MSIVQPLMDGAQVVDLCAGSGALGLEALSRGAAHCDFVERAMPVLRVLESNIATLGADERATVHRSEALKFVGAPTGGAPRWTVAFADPPYGEGTALALAERWLAEPFAATFGVEHEASLVLPAPAGGPAPDRRSYGDTAVTFYRLPD